MIAHTKIDPFARTLKNHLARMNQLTGKILIVDDSAVCRRPMERLLRLEGYTPYCVSDGAEALKSLASVRPALVLLDLSMPGMDGITFLQRLHEDPEWASLPVIVISGETSGISVRMAKELGAKDVFVKTRFSPEELFGSIQRSLQV